MVRDANGGAGVARRPNNSRAGVLGSSGWASAGNGCGLTVPLSWANAASALPIASARTVARPRLLRISRRMSVVMVMSGHRFAGFAAPGRVYAQLMSNEYVSVLAGKPRDRSRQ